jgi:tetratricopeptide (TPR) repeat protein
LSFLTYPAIGVVAAFVFSLFFGENVVIDKFTVPNQLQERGYNSDEATQQFTDALRQVTEVASSEVTRLDVDPDERQQAAGLLEDYFASTVVINSTRAVLGLVPFYLKGSITQVGDEDVLTVRIFTNNDNHPVHLAVSKGDPKNLQPMFLEEAVNVLEVISPYVAVLYYRQTEVAAGKFDFPKTQAAADRYLTSQPPSARYLIYGLLGRMHMIKAEQDKTLTPDQKRGENDAALSYLSAALYQNQNFLFPYLNMATIEAGRGQYDVADQYYARAVEINPNYLITRELWGDMLVKLGRQRDATYQYVAAVEIDPQSAELHDKLATVYRALGMTDAARTQWEKARQISPSTLAYVKALAELDQAQSVAGEDGSCNSSGASRC